MHTVAATMTMDARDRFQALLAEHARIAPKVAAMYCRHPEDRRDLAQEIVVQAWRAFGRYDPARSFSTWLYRIALNVAISQVRSASQRERHAVPLDESAHAIADERAAPHETDERLHALQRCIDTLAPLDRALMLLYLEERSQIEIADVLGISASNVGTRINRLKQRIRARLAQTMT
ncbi:MAG: sigma-70 family RNA polymerase sigma factor [Proteobacteria bacterium]|nr:sigma-70 family RNA polymerase sigma factor [Pseudomonadota bacterium]